MDSYILIYEIVWSVGDPQWYNEIIKGDGADRALREWMGEREDKTHRESERPLFIATLGGGHPLREIVLEDEPTYKVGAAYKGDV